MRSSAGHRTWRSRLASVVLATACLSVSAPLADAAPAGQRGGPLSDPFFAYARPADFPDVVVDHVRVPLRDRSFLACDLSRPGRSGAPARGRFPGLVGDYTAYSVARQDPSGILTSSLATLPPRVLAERGYNVIVCDARGTGGSPGELDPFSPQEQRDTYDLVEWLASQPFSTGKVGQYGTSYGAHTALLNAVNRPPHLTTIVPVMGFHDWYENSIYRGGIESPSIYPFELVTTPLTAGSLNAPVDLLRNTFLEYREHPLHDAFWRDRSVASRWDRLTIPVLELGGWFDRYRDGVTKNQMARPGNVWLVMGPWSHATTAGQVQEPMGPGPYLAWFDHWLRDDPDAPLPRAKVTSFETAIDGARQSRWHQFAAWPPPEVRSTRLHLTATHALRHDAGRSALHSYTVDAFDLGSDKSAANPVNDGDQRYADLQRVTYDTPALSDDVVLAGPIEVRLRVRLTAGDGNLVVRLMDVGPDGTSLRVSAGWMKVSHRDGHDHLAPTRAGTTYEVPVHVWPVHHRFPKGHRIRLAVSSGDYPEIAADAPPGRVSILAGAGGSAADLPVLTGNIPP